MIRKPQMALLNMLAFYFMLVGNSVFFFRAMRMASLRNMIQMTGKADGKNSWIWKKRTIWF